MVQADLDDHSRDILGCIEDGLLKYGPAVFQVITYEFQREYKAEGRAMVTRPDLLVKIVHKIFGDSAASIEASMVRELNVTFDLSKTHKSLESAIAEIKRKNLMNE